ncbi:ankyrin repeat-containing domain protein [Hypoxylon trugodes]|uniref:ankyrin repeat-containing domain protein n=1 Tax=Hypoxylon trugodes TaxID=326681 RepID=UPI0021994FC9|nr:ankyrin repeat-containing domain protein [Hypoxylon trugodes]KAI1390860.1 ankyrin repeat-containing domain protein [Hypoxylon trugodes]
MDGLSIAASIAGLVSVAELVFRTTARYVKCVKGAETEVEDLLREVKEFTNILHNLSLVAYELEDPLPTNDSASQPSANLRLQYLNDCRPILNRLEKGLYGLRGDLESPSKFNRLQSRLKWPFSSVEMKEMIQSIQRQKQTLNLAVSADSFYQLKKYLSRQKDASKRLNNLQSTVTEILDIETKIILDKTRRDVLDFFTKETNPRPNFEMNRKLRHPLTGAWFTGGTGFKNWYSNPGARIWISGIPGAGKSVLAGAIVTECFSLCSKDDRVAVAYFFCSYQDEKTHLAKNILSSLASQLARQSEEAFQILHEYYEELLPHEYLPGDPSPARLLEVITDISTLFDQIFIIVDGLDECVVHTCEVVDGLADLSTSQNHEIITMALLSRDEFQIRERLESEFKHIDIQAHTEDIQLYVASELEERINSRKLRLRDMSLKDHIMTQLVDGAKGMFRWVACQLDHLCELSTDRARREALTKLPPTLPASYERILHQVQSSNEQVQKLVQKCLQLIAFSRHGRLNIQQICEAVSISIDQDTFEEDEVVEADEIMKHCSSLIRKSADCKTFEFTHYSVMEFLEGICTTHPTLSSYHISVDKGHSLLAPLFLRYLTFKNHEETPVETKNWIQHTVKRNEARPLYEIAAMYWLWHMRREMASENTATRHFLGNLFDASKTASFTSWAIELIRHCLSRESVPAYLIRADFGRDEQTALTIITAVTRPDFTPLHMASALGLPNVCRHLLEQGAKVDTRSRFGTPLHCAIGSLNIFIESESCYAIRMGILGEMVPACARYQTIQILMAAGGTTSSLFTTPFKQGALLSLARLSSWYDEDFNVMADLIRADVRLDDHDVIGFEYFYKFIVDRASPDMFKAEHPGGKAVVSLLEALGRPEDDSGPRSRLYTMTLKFANSMKVELDRSLHVLVIDDWASEEALRKFALSVIENNDITSLERFVESGQLEMLKAVKLSEDDDDWTALHSCVQARSIDILKLLLEVGWVPNVAAADGKTPLHLCSEDKDRDIIRVLLEHGASTIIHEADMNTIWHTCARVGSIQSLKVLIELDQDKDTALKMQSKQGFTPICEALNKFKVNAVRLLMPYCNSLEFWKGDILFFRRAANIGSIDIVQHLLDIGIPLDNLDPDLGSPLHSLGQDATLKLVKLLILLFPHCHIRCGKGRTPFEELLIWSIEKDNEVHPDIFIELLAGFGTSKWQQCGNLWASVSSAVVPYALSTEKDINWLKQLLFRLSETAVVRVHEEEMGTSAFVQLIDQLESVSNKLSPRSMQLRQGKCLSDLDEPQVLGNWSSFSEILINIASKTSHWDSSLTQDSAAKLLSWSIIHDDTTMIRFLLNKGVDVHNRVDNLSAMELACLSQVSISEENFSRLLSSARHEELIATNEKVDGFSLVHLASFPGPEIYEDRNTRKLKQILDAGVDCNACSNQKSPPLLYSIGHYYLKASKVLIDYGADVLLANSFGMDAALIAVQVNNLPALKTVAQTVSRKQLTPLWGRTWSDTMDGHLFSGGNVIHLAAISNAVECIEFYLNEKLLYNIEPLDDDMETPMHYAASFNSLGVIEFLKERGCSIDAVRRDGLSPLHLAVQCKHFDAVKMLLDLGAQMKPCSLGMTPLAYAHQAGDYNIIRLLKTHERQEFPLASPAQEKGVTILAEAYCAAITRNDISACEDLRKHGRLVNLELEYPWHVTPLMAAVCARRDPKLIEWLLNSGETMTGVFEGPNMPNYITVLEAAISTSIYNSLLPMLFEKYIEQGGDLLCLPRSPLHIAVLERNHEGLGILLSELRKRYGVTSKTQPRCGFEHLKSDSKLCSLINQRNQLNRGATALHQAAGFGDVEGVEILIANMANVDLPDDDGRAPLHFAARKGLESVVDLLIGHGARLEPRDRWGETPLMKACRSGRLNIAKCLIGCKDPGVSINDYRNNMLYLLTLDKSGHPDDIALWELLCKKGVDPHQATVLGVSAIHFVLAHSQQDLIRHLMRKEPDLKWAARVEWSRLHILRVGDMGRGNVTPITDNYCLLHRYANLKWPLRVSNSVTSGEESLFYFAASWGLVKALDNLLIIGADLEQEFGQHGTALTLASANGHLDAVKYLFRKNPRGVPEQNQVIKDAIGATLDHEETVHWFLVTRHIDQHKVAYCESDSSQERIKQWGWSGIQSIPISLRWDQRQRRGESMMEYAKRRREIELSFRGKVAK